METIKPSMFPKLLLLVSTSTSQPFPLCVHCLLDILSEVLLSWCLFVGNLEPITVFDQGGIHVSLHFAKDSPPGHPGVAVVVISTVNTSALHVKDFMFQAAVPKVSYSKHIFKTYDQNGMKMFNRSFIYLIMQIVCLFVVL